MAVVSGENVMAQVAGFGALPALRQLGLMVGLAVSVALGVTVAMWSQTPNYSMLYGGLSAKEMSQVTQALDAAAIEYELGTGNGSVLVAADRIHEARMKLAAIDLAVGGEVGFELLEKGQGFGSSSFLQKARYNRAIEGELAQSISKLNIVESARVHIAIPKQSVFARLNSKPTVSVLLNLYAGRRLDEMQVAGIVNMVASSVPELEAERVTVIDQRGRLLSGKGGDSNMMLSSTQFEYSRKLEERYVQSILDIIGPIVGIDGVRTQVVADVDFTSQEQTRESYQPDQKALRSEQLYEENGSMNSAAAGIPGALTNQPPAAGTTENVITEGEPEAVTNTNITTRAIRNYEMDRTISHTRQSPATLKRLSVAVLLDHRSIYGKKGKVTKEPLTEEEIQRITSLVKEAVGLDEARGDTINIVNTPFQQPAIVKPIPEAPLWEQPWVLSLAKQLLGGLAVLVIAFGILRPMLNNLATQGKPVLALGQDGQLALGEDQLALGNQPPIDINQLKELAGSIAREDPKRVAKVMNTWVSSND
jgi:flagellar M-ring protein FliF